MTEHVAVEGPVRTFKRVVASEVRLARTEFREQYPDADLESAGAIMWKTGKFAFVIAGDVFIETTQT